MAEANDPKVLEFRMQRLRKAPRSWTYWVAGFTAVNGMFVAVQQDITILAGLAFPFILPGAVAHLIAAAAFALVAYLSNTRPQLLIAPLVIYVADALFTAYAGIWSGLVMHVFVLAFVGFSFLGIRALRNLQAQVGTRT